MGNKYPIEYVERLRNGIKRYSPSILWTSEQAQIVCITDQPETVEGVTNVLAIGTGLEGWWGKMMMFNPAVRSHARGGVSIYLDLDTVIVDSLRPLIDFALTTKDFAICANFTRRAGKLNYPCAYGSCVMVFPEGFGLDIFEQFVKSKKDMIEAAGPFGDQWVIERMSPGATLLQDVMPSGYFVGRREFDVVRPEGAALMIFAGKVKPHNCEIQWIKEEWK
jgi:hypothetical protein